MGYINVNTTTDSELIDPAMNIEDAVVPFETTGNFGLVTQNDDDSRLRWQIELYKLKSGYSMHPGSSIRGEIQAQNAITTIYTLS